MTTTEGEARRDAGMAAVEAASDAGHIKWIDQVLDRWASNGATFSMNELREAFQGTSVRPNLLGARMRAAARRGDLVHVGYVKSTLPSTHAHEIKTWRGAR